MTAIVGGLFGQALIGVVRIYEIAATQQGCSLGVKVCHVNPLPSPVFALILMITKEMSFIGSGA